MSAYKITCPGCGGKMEADSSLAGTEVVCPSCSRQFKAPTLLKPASADADKAAPAGKNDAAVEVKRFSRNFVGKLTDWAGEEKIEGFSLKQLFSEVFSRHSSQEVEEYFTVGTMKTTPSIADVDPSWPHPWVFFRTFVGAVIVYFGLLMAWNQYGNVNLVPGLIMVGSFAVPLAMLIFFLEMNVRKNVSLYQVVRLIFAGGVLGLILSLVFYQVEGALNLGWVGDPIAGPVEESGKLLALILVLNSMRHRYVLNGLLFGAAVGAGFASLESMGYALNTGLDSTEAMKSVIMTRGMLSPFGHIAWTAMCAAALWKVMGSDKFRFDMLKDMRFLRVFIIAVVLHMLWDLPFTGSLPFFAGYFVLGVIAWVVIIAQIQSGLKQLSREKETGAANVAAPSTASSGA